MYLLARRFSAPARRPLKEKSQRHSELMQRIRNIEENRTMDLLWEGLAKTPMPRFLLGLLTLSAAPQIATIGIMIYADYDSLAFTLASRVGSASLATSACLQGAILLGLEALQYHPLNTNKSRLLSGAIRVLLGLGQLGIAMVVVDRALRDEWEGPLTAFVTQILAFVFMLSSAKGRVVPFWALGWTGGQLLVSGTMCLFMMHSLIGQRTRDLPSK